jgi:hypothetical protein
MLQTREKSLAPAKNLTQFLGCPAHSLVTTLTELSNLVINLHTYKVNSWDNAVGIVTGYGMDNEKFGVQVQVDQEFSLLHDVQTGSEAHPDSYPMGIGVKPTGGPRHSSGG